MTLPPRNQTHPITKSTQMAKSEETLPFWHPYECTWLSAWRARFYLLKDRKKRLVLNHICPPSVCPSAVLTPGLAPPVTDTHIFFCKMHSWEEGITVRSLGQYPDESPGQDTAGQQLRGWLGEQYHSTSCFIFNSWFLHDGQRDLYFFSTKRCG